MCLHGAVHSPRILTQRLWFGGALAKIQFKNHQDNFSQGAGGEYIVPSSQNRRLPQDNLQKKHAMLMFCIIETKSQSDSRVFMSLCNGEHVWVYLASVQLSPVQPWGVYGRHPVNKMLWALKSRSIRDWVRQLLLENLIPLSVKTFYRVIPTSHTVRITII